MVRLAFVMLACCVSAQLQAAQIRGQVRVGSFIRKAELKEPFQGELSDDEAIFSGQFRLEMNELDESKDRILFELRDKFDNFGKLDRQNLKLTPYNRMRVRTVAFKRPWEANRMYFTLGRFSLSEANLVSHDGGEVGFRFSKSTRLGLFAGRGPKDILVPLYVDPQTQSVKDSQLGAYLTYESKEGVEDSSYITQAIGQAPTYDITDAENHSYYYQQGLWTFTSAHRLGSLVLYDVSPKSVLRRAAASYTFLTEHYRANAYIQQTNTEDYLIKQTLQDTLAPSPVQTLSLDLRQRLNASFALDYSASLGKRTLDGRSQSEVALGALLPRLFSEASSLRTQVGTRKNFLSKDKFVQVSYDYWARSFSIGVSHTVTKEDYEDGSKNTRQVSMLDSGFFISEELRGSLGYQLEQDNKIKANSLLFMIGYRFGEASVSPLRTKTPRFESM